MIPKKTNTAPQSSLGAFRIHRLSTINSFFFLGHSTLVGFTRARITRVQENLERHLEIRKTFEIGLACITTVRLMSVQENRGGRPDTVITTVDAFVVHFQVNIL